METISEELKYRGVAYLGQVLNQEEIEWFKSDLENKKSEEIAHFGKEFLLERFALETIQDLGRFAGQYYQLIEHPKINECVNTLLNDKAVIHSYNAIILDSQDKSGMVGHQFHRDMPWFPDCRTSIIIMIPLVDYSEENGSTQFVAGSHLFKDRPSDLFMEKYVENAKGKAGEAFVIDSTTWHRAGNNQSGKSRPMMVLKYTLAPFKQQIEFYLSNPSLSEASPLVKQRLGWNVRVPHDFVENMDWNQETRKFKSGQYDMTHTYLKNH